ncbi:amidohydrolase [Velocimicrobium porci]|uniref:5-methylthioadenosine/S-adenosylhomocysteine deaminase n=1 Tax=Velocimicrobium porci TaxID=2606634 RepID=A0A6L5XWR0_9FIRM|nr:amidohydrolase [Velocimicrobium porci]MSS63235.1 amidohydrolase [Velocimicrobium porci]
MGILLKNIQMLLYTEKGPVVKRDNIYIEDRIIKAIGERPDTFSEDKVIDGTDRFAIPGMINAHTHSYMAFLRNVADDLSFMDWLFGTIDPLEQKMSSEDAYWGANLAILEMMKSGTTCFNDMQMNIHQTTRAVKESGMRAVICRGLVGSGNDEAGRIRLNEAYEEREAFKDCDRLNFFLGPHAPYTCDEEYLKIVASEAKKEKMGIHIHLAESLSEMEGCAEKYHCTPIELAERCGLFDVPAIAAHCVNVNDGDLDILKEKNVSVVTNPASNMKLGNGFAPVAKMLEKGINVCLGTDGAASNNSLNMFHEMNLLSLIHKGVAKVPQCISAKEAIQIATINGAKALGLEQQIGSIEVGKKADLAIINLRTPSFMPKNNLIAGLAYSANGSEVETVIIDGTITMENRNVLTMDEERIYFEMDQILKKMGLENKVY